jgi:activator of HSP90 ATPase
MSKPIHQSVTLRAKAVKLFNTFLDPKAHAAVVGSKVSITRREGARWKAFDGMLLGRNLRIVPGRLIVQSWRSSGWKSGDADSILVLAFSDTPKGGRIDLTHVNVPGHDHKGVTEGWKKYYWRPWKKRLAA